MLKGLRRLINRTGFDVVRISAFHRDFSEHLKRVLDANQIDAVIDVGANKGQYAAMLRQIGFRGHIYSFEPVSSIYAELCRVSKEDRKWHCFNLALGDEVGEKQINVYDSHVFSSFLEANDYSKAIWKSLNGVTPERVKVARLEDIFDTLPEKEECHRFMLKLDTQGFDLQAFRGTGTYLDQISVLQTELAMIAIYDAMPDPFATLAEYSSKGFCVSGMYPINRDVSQAVIEYDCVMVRRG